MSAGRTITLNSGHKIPTLGFGTWQAPPGEARTAVYEALKAGYRHLDLAKVYGNQPEIGEGIKKALEEVPGLKREDIFITSKLWNNSHQPDKVAAALDETLQELGLEYLDLYLIHWPVGFKAGANLFPKNDAGFLDIDETVTISQTWKAVSELPKTKARSVGVSNFTIEQLETVINDTGVVPAVNQIERHPRILDLPLIEYLKKKNIIVTAYSAFGNNGVGEPLIITHPDVKATAERLSAAQGKTVTPAQVILAWSQHGGHTVIPKSVTASRIAENFQQIDIDDEAIQTINKIGEKPHRFNVPYTYNPKWNVNIFGDEKEAAAETKVILKL